MYDSDATPKPGELLITGWVVERQAPADATKPEYDMEIWVKPIAA
jgi:hypothetical protein